FIPFDMGAPILSLFDDQVKWMDDGHDSQTAHDARRGRAFRRIGADRFQPGQQPPPADVRGDPSADRGGDGRARLSPQPDRPRAGYPAGAAELHVPVVLLEEPRGGGAATMSVRADNRAGARRLAEHLIERGHRRVAFIAAHQPWPMLEQRHRGYHDALAAADI